MPYFQRAKGTTLVELLVVMAIATIALAIVIPAIGSGASNMKLRSTAREIVAWINRARELAISRQREVILEIDEAKGLVAIIDKSRSKRQEMLLPKSVLVRVGPIDAGHIEPQGDREMKLERLLFQPDGAIPAVHMTLRLGRHNMQIGTDLLTGTAMVAEDLP